MARTIKLKRKVSDKPKGKNALDIEKNRYYIKPGEGGTLDKEDELLKGEKGLYTLADKDKGLKARRGGKFNLKQKGKSAK